MTPEELIKELKQLPKDCLIFGTEEGYYSQGPINEINIEKIELDQRTKEEYKLQDKVVYSICRSYQNV